MSALRFSSNEALVAVLAAGVVPDGITGTGARCGWDDEGLWLVPDARLPGSTTRALAARGVALGDTHGKGRMVACWAEALPPVPTAEPEEATPALFLVSEKGLSSLAGELLRLGCDRQRWAVGEHHAMLIAQDPPWYTVLRALDPDDLTQVFLQRIPGVWVEIGHEHPLARSLRPADGEWVLIPRAGPWIRVEDGPWVSLYDQLDLVLPAASQVLSADMDPETLQVPLRLVDSGRTTPPSLWVLRGDARSRIDRMLGSVPDDVVQRLLFAATEGEEPMIVLRARPSTQGPPALEIPGETYAPLLELPNLYRPDNTTLEPPLRRDRVREVLAPEPFEVAWLVRTETGFHVERIAEQAFRPLSDWVEYVAHRDAHTLTSWVEAAIFEFDNWVDLGIEWEQGSKSSPPPKRSKPRDRKSKPVEEREAEPAPAPPRTRTARARPKPVPVVTGAEESETARELAALEKRFLAFEAPPDAPERLGMWREMATLTRKLDRQRDASLCWSHALWDCPTDRTQELALEWAEQELGALDLDAQGARSLALEATGPRALYAVTACLLAGALEPDASLAALFDRHDESIDVRAAWISRRLLAGADELAVARARDKILARLHNGLSVERDTPVFLRMIDAAAIETLSAHLTAQREHFRRTKRKRSVIEADTSLTFAYIDLVFAWGFASLGDRNTATQLRSAIEVLDRDDPVHDALITGYEARIEHALEGVPREAPLPAAAAEKFNGLDALQRYKVDRLRQASDVLETQEHLDPFVAYNKNYEDPRGPEFAGLRTVEDPNALRPHLVRIVDSAESHEERVRLLDGVLDFLPLLPAADSLPLLERIVELGSDAAPLDRLLLLEDALLVAGQLGRASLVRTLVSQLDEVLQEVSAQNLADAGGSLVKGLRSLRRVGLQQEATQLLERMLERADGRDHESMVARIAVAGGLFGVGAEKTAIPLLDKGLAELDLPTLKLPARLRITRALAIALASAPRAVALERLPLLAARLDQITDSFNTNSHFCLSMVSFAESIVLGYADTNLALGPTARRWLDDAEYSVRRRIHLES